MSLLMNKINIQMLKFKIIVIKILNYFHKKIKKTLIEIQVV